MAAPRSRPDAAQGAGARSRLYAVLASVFGFPDQELYAGERAYAKATADGQPGSERRVQWT